MSLLRSLVILLLAPSLLLAQQLPPAPPANPLLVNHKNWFVPAQVWDIQKDTSLAKYRPETDRPPATQPVLSAR